MQDVLSRVPRWEGGYVQSGCARSPAAFPYLEVGLLFTFAISGFNNYLTLRQYRRLVRTRGAPPEDLKSGFGGAGSATKHEAERREIVREMAERTDSAFAYNLDKMRFGLVTNAWQLLLHTAGVLMGLAPFLFDAAEAVLASAGRDAASLPRVRVVVFILLSTVLQMVVGIPFDLYKTFVIEERHGFNKSTLGVFAVDKLKELALYFTILPVVFYGFSFVLGYAKDTSILYLWLFVMAVHLSLLLVVPQIMRLFNDFRRLEDGELLSAITAVAESPDIGFPMSRVFVMDGSKRTAHSNAFFTGLFGRKEIVLYDTLVDKFSVPEICAVICHEFGHWHWADMREAFLVTQLYFLTFFVSVSHFLHSDDLRAAFGFRDPSLFIAVYLFSETLWTPLSELWGFVFTVDTRRKEFRADRYAVAKGRGEQLQTALLKLHRNSMANLDPDPLFSAFNYSHPPCVERLRAIRAAQAARVRKAQ